MKNNDLFLFWLVPFEKHVVQLFVAVILKTFGSIYTHAIANTFGRSFYYVIIINLSYQTTKVST